MKNKNLLLIIDIQMDYFPGGRMELASPVEAATNAALLLGFFRKEKRPIIHIRNEAVHSGATFFLPNTPGVAFHPLVAPAIGEEVITKHYPNSFRETSLQETLLEHDPEEIVVCGMMTHQCVSTTVRAGWDLGWKMSLIHDACATRSLSSDAGSADAVGVHLSHVAALQRFAGIVSTRSWIAGSEP